MQEPPTFSDDTKYRIKPEPVTVYVVIKTEGNYQHIVNTAVDRASAQFFIDRIATTPEGLHIVKCVEEQKK